MQTDVFLSIPPPVVAPELFTVLIVDDDQDCRALMRDAIAQLGCNCRVIEQENGRETLEFLLACDRENRPDVIFLDLEMPRMGGLETLEVIKADPRLKEIPTIILTGVADQQVIERAALLGANSYTVKPRRVEQFMHLITVSANYWLNVHRYPRRRDSSCVFD